MSRNGVVVDGRRREGSLLTSGQTRREEGGSEERVRSRVEVGFGSRDGRACSGFVLVLNRNVTSEKNDGLGTKSWKSSEGGVERKKEHPIPSVSLSSPPPPLPSLV